ncbi:hypothetical protein J4Q44_G00336920 [Coregonus suidteri]|uniref:Uncharacterized protein n=1 Tax=Coregonus suidteri TaxID=861788 RepID=A0AAN8KV91_9TELE
MMLIRLQQPCPGNVTVVTQDLDDADTDEPEREPSFCLRHNQLDLTRPLPALPSAPPSPAPEPCEGPSLYFEGIPGLLYKSSR